MYLITLKISKETLKYLNAKLHNIAMNYILSAEGLWET